MQSESGKSGRASGCLARLFWMGAGNLILVLTAIGIGQSRAGFTFGKMDVLFWATAFCLLAVRYVDIRYLAGETTDNKPASMSDWRRYAAAVFGVALVMWLLAHVIA
jgi:hypothetical protein